MTMTRQKTSLASLVTFVFLSTWMTALTTLTMTSSSEAKNYDCLSQCLKLCNEFNGDFNQVVHQLPRSFESGFEAGFEAGTGTEAQSNEGPKSVFEQEFSPVGKRS